MGYPGSLIAPVAEEEITRRRILLAEDEPMVRKLVQSLLTTDGFEVMAAGDGEEALALSRSFDGVIDLLLTDVLMPRMNGPELVRQICLERPDINILVMSAYGSGEFERMPRVGNFIRKPFMAKALKQKVQDILELPAPPKEPS